MRKFLPVVFGCVAALVNFTAFVFFVAWLAETDFMFGHFKGEPRYIIGALILSLIGAVATFVWISSVISARRRLESSAPRPGKAFRILGSLGVLGTAVPLILIIPTGLYEWPDAQLKLRRSAVSRLAWIGGEERQDPEQEAKLVLALSDEDYYVRNGAASSLSELSHVDRSAIPALIEAAALREDLTSMYAVRTLEKFGPKAEAAVPVLVSLLDSDIVLRQAAGQALGAIGRLAQTAVIEVSRSSDPSLRAAAAVAVGLIGSAEAGMRIVAMVEDPDPRVRQSAIESLGFSVYSARAALNRVLEDPDPKVRAAAERTLRNYAQQVQENILVARNELSSPEPLNRVNAAWRLGNFEDAPRPALPELRVALGDADLRVRTYAARAIWVITGDAEESLPTIIEALNSGAENRELRFKVLKFLWERGPSAKGLLPTLRALEQDPDRGIRVQATTAIRLIDVAE